MRSGTNFSVVTIVRNVSGLTFDSKYADTGAINFTLPDADAKSLGLQANSVVEVCPNGISGVPNLYYGLDGYQATQTTDGAILATFSGKSLVNWLTDCIVYPSTWPAVPQTNPDGTTTTVIQGHSFQDATPGNIVRTLIARGVERGGLQWLDYSTFSGTNASNGGGWASTLTVTYSNGTSLLSVLQDLATRNLIEYQMIGNSLRIYNYGTLPVHYAPEQIMFRRGRDLVEQTRTTDASDVSTVVLMVGDDAALTESDSAHNAAALASVGRRRERFVTQSGITDLPTLLFLANAELTITGHVQTEDTLGVNDLGAVKPWVDYQIGDWVWVDFDGIPRNIQVQQIAAAQQDNNDLTLGLTLGDLIKDQDEKLQIKINNMTGNAGSSYGALPTAVDFNGPTPVTGFSADADAVRDSNGRDSATVTLTWTRPTTASDGGALTGLVSYQIRYQVGAAVGGNVWTNIGDVPANANPLSAIIPNLPCGQPFTSQIRALDSKGNTSAWTDQSNDIITPIYLQTLTTPSTPAAAAIFKGLAVSWDGLDDGGNAYDRADFAQLNVYISTTSGFTPGPSTLITAMTTMGGTVTIPNLSYTSTYYVRTVAVDHSKSYSPASIQSAGVMPLKIAAGDVTNVGGNNVYTQATAPTGALNPNDLWINTSQGNSINIYNGTAWTPYQFGTNALGPNSIDSSKIVTAGLTAGIIASGTISAATINMATNAGGVPATINIGNPGSTGIQLSSLGGLTAWSSGTQTLSVSTSGTVTVTGTIQTGVSGQRVIMDPTGLITFWAPNATFPANIHGENSNGQNRTQWYAKVANGASGTILGPSVQLYPPDDGYNGVGRVATNAGRMQVVEAIGINAAYSYVGFNPPIASAAGGNFDDNAQMRVQPGSPSDYLSHGLNFYNSGYGNYGRIDFYTSGSANRHFRFTDGAYAPYGGNGGVNSFIELDAASFITPSSSETIKQDVSSAKSDVSIEAIKATPIVNFRRKYPQKKYKSLLAHGKKPELEEKVVEAATGEQEIGFIMEKAHPLIKVRAHGTENEDPNASEGIDLLQTIAVLWRANQKMLARIEELEKKSV